MEKIVNQFVKAFQKAIQAEMDAMREAQGPFELAVDDVKPVDVPGTARYVLYDLSVPEPNEKLVLNGECTLVHDGGRVIVTIVEIDGHRLGVRCEREIPGSSSYTLTIYPWFLYERLTQVLGALSTSPNWSALSALTLFGKVQPLVDPLPGAIDAPELNPSQLKAVQLCRDSNLAFVWGPPGTGKTTTLAHIVMDLLAQGLRVVVTSTTNAAVDQVLEKLARLGSARALMREGGMIRMGQTDAKTFGASLHEVVHRQTERLRSGLHRLMERNRAAGTRLQHCDRALSKLDAAKRSRQLDMFVPPREDSLSLGDLTEIFSPTLRQHVLRLDPLRVRAALERRKDRLTWVRARYRVLLDADSAALREKEKAVLRKARVVLATMSNLYVSDLLRDESFDVVIVEEAGMAVLPTLFYCSGLGRLKVIAIGDPRQLPPIVVSRDPFAYKAMGRNIFDVTAPDPATSRSVAMLDTQYRMHPLIGSFVSDLFYGGRLLNDRGTESRQAIAARRPYPGRPLVVVDTSGRTSCSRDERGFSRVNQQTAQECVRLAREAVQHGVESVAIITPYVRQSRLISDLLEEVGVPEERVECRTVHRFQGNERDMVILDTVDTFPMKPGVLLAGRLGASSAPNLLNVSISRAKGKLVIVADVAYFRSKAPGSAIDTVLTKALRVGACVNLQAET